MGRIVENMKVEHLAEIQKRNQHAIKIIYSIKGIDCEKVNIPF